MKKALQSYAFRAEVSLAARAVVSGACEAHPRSFFDRFAEILGGDPGRQLVRRPRVLERRLRRRPPSPLVRLRRGLGKGPGREAKTRWSSLAESLSQAAGDLRLELLQLEGPRGGGGVHVQRAIARDPRGPRVRRDRLADRPWPRGHHVGHRTRRAEAAELAPDLAPDPVHQVACTSLVPSARCATSSACDGSPGSALRLALVTSAWPELRTRSARICRRPGSSSERTSSSRRSGRTPRRSSSSSASPSRSASTARRCS